MSNLGSGTPNLGSGPSILGSGTQNLGSAGMLGSDLYVVARVECDLSNMRPTCGTCKKSENKQKVELNELSKSTSQTCNWLVSSIGRAARLSELGLGK